MRNHPVHLQVRLQHIEDTTAEKKLAKTSLDVWWLEQTSESHPNLERETSIHSKGESLIGVHCFAPVWQRDIPRLFCQSLLPMIYSSLDPKTELLRFGISLERRRFIVCRDIREMSMLLNTLHKLGWHFQCRLLLSKFGI